MMYFFLIWAAILHAILKFLKCSMVPAGHHSDSSITTYSLTQYHNTFTMQYNAGSSLELTGICVSPNAYDHKSDAFSNHLVSVQWFGLAFLLSLEASFFKYNVHVIYFYCLVRLFGVFVLLRLDFLQLYKNNHRYYNYLKMV